ncbi:uncharacterized protein LOC125054989 [Pieris napi]|uniref:uncharacterized protein LOC125054989 n=1 Tax=Pieris napi TaxID=78633 RepID=UPI001FB98F3F|nr:uncharacterized protein LOC125054989 [Pieris napi]
MPSFWASVSTTPFLCSFMLGRGDLTCEGMSSASLPRRLPSGQPRPLQVKCSGLGGRETLGTPGLENQLPKIRIGTNPKFRIPWNSLEYNGQCDVATQGKNTAHKPYSRTDAVKKTHQPPRVTKSARATKLRKLCRAPREASLSPGTDFSATLQQDATSSMSTAASDCSAGTDVVARSYSSDDTYTQRTCNPLPSDGRFGLGLGGTSRREPYVRKMVIPTEKVALQQKGTICSDSRNKNKCKNITKHTRINTIGQPNSDCIHSKRRWNEIDRVTDTNLQIIAPDGQIQHNSVGTLPTREIQHHSGQIIKGKKACGMAPSSSSNSRDLSEVGTSGDRPICNKGDCSSKKLRINKLQRSIRKLHRCLQQNMALSSSMGVPPSKSVTQSFSTPEPGDGNLSDSCSRLAARFLASGPEIQISRSPPRNSTPIGDTHRYDNCTASSTNTNIDPKSLENWGWGAQIKDWSKQEKDLLLKSWRHSTLSTYLPAIKRWLSWCDNSQVNPKSPQPADIAKFLMSLFLKENLSYATILVHKSAILTFCGPHVEQQTFSNFIIKHTLRAIGVAKPKVVKSSVTWDPRIVLDWLSSNPPKDTLFDTARRTATVLLLASGRRVHDLTLLKITDEHFVDDGDNIYLTPTFGSKTDTHSRRQSTWKLSKHHDKNICPVTLVRLQIAMSNTRRSQVKNLNNIFISINNKIKAASRTIIGNWVRTVLKDSGIYASPGSCRAAVASLGWVENQPIDDILARGNWKSSNTFFNHYCREIDSRKEKCSSFFNTFAPS